MSAESNPFSKAPEADKAFAFGKDANASFGSAQEALDVARDLTADTPHEPIDFHRPAVQAALEAETDEGASAFAVANVNMLKVPQARSVVAARRELTRGVTKRPLDSALDDLYGNSQSVEGAAMKDMTARGILHPVTADMAKQMGIDKADRANRADAGLPPRVPNLK